MALALVSARYPQPPRMIRTSGLGRISLLSFLIQNENISHGFRGFTRISNYQLFFGAGLVCGVVLGFAFSSLIIWSISRLIWSICLRKRGCIACIPSAVMAGISRRIFCPVGVE